MNLEFHIMKSNNSYRNIHIYSKVTYYKTRGEESGIFRKRIVSKNDSM